MPAADPLHPERIALDLYAAVLDGGPLVGVVDTIRRAVGADSAWISRITFAGGRPQGAAPLEHAGFDPAVLTEYAAHWVPHDPFLAATQTLPAGIVNFERLVPHASYMRSPFWNDFARFMEQPVQHVAGAVVDVPGAASGILALQRSGRPGAFGAAQEKWLAALYPHLSHAMVAEARLAEAGLLAAATGAGLDALNQGIAIIAPDGRMVRANAALLEQVARRDGLRLTGHGLLADDPRAQAVLARHIATALAAAAGRHPLPDAGIFAIPCRSGGAWRVQVLALNAAANGLFAGFTGALVMVADPHEATLPPPATVQAVLGLTRAEAELALALAAGQGLAHHARQRGVAVETLRTHLASIRRKTGCRRQAELVAMILSLSP